MLQLLANFDQSLDMKTLLVVGSQQKIIVSDLVRHHRILPKKVRSCVRFACKKYSILDKLVLT